MSGIRHFDGLQWFGLLAAPLAWAGQLVAGYFLAETHCAATRWDGSWPPAELAVTAAAALVAVVAEGAAARVFVGLRDTGDSAAGPAGRRRFFAVGGLVGNVLFLVAILLSGVAVVSINGMCLPG